MARPQARPRGESQEDPAETTHPDSGSAARESRADDSTRRDIRAAILDLLAQRAPGATICPSEAARVVGGDDAFRPLMDATRAEAATLVREGRVEVTQRGHAVDPATARGPIRLRLTP